MPNATHPRGCHLPAPAQGEPPAPGPESALHWGAPWVGPGGQASTLTPTRDAAQQCQCPGGTRRGWRACALRLCAGTAEHWATAGTRRLLQGPTEPRACALRCGDVPGPGGCPATAAAQRRRGGAQAAAGARRAGSVAGAGAIRATLGCRGEEGTVPSRVRRRVGEAEQVRRRAQRGRRGTQGPRGPHCETPRVLGPQHSLGWSCPGRASRTLTV